MILQTAGSTQRLLCFVPNPGYKAPVKYSEKVWIINLFRTVPDDTFILCVI